MGVGVLQHKGNINKVNKLKTQPKERSLGLIESVHRKYLLFLVAFAAHTAKLATAKPLADFFLNGCGYSSKHRQ
jgi:hypothetical protein